jgi:hypothetical protein
MAWDSPAGRAGWGGGRQARESQGRRSGPQRPGPAEQGGEAQTGPHQPARRTGLCSVGTTWKGARAARLLRGDAGPHLPVRPALCARPAPLVPRSAGLRTPSRSHRLRPRPAASRSDRQVPAADRGVARSQGGRREPRAPARASRRRARAAAGTCRREGERGAGPVRPGRGSRGRTPARRRAVQRMRCTSRQRKQVTTWSFTSPHACMKA